VQTFCHQCAEKLFSNIPKGERKSFSLTIFERAGIFDAAIPAAIFVKLQY